MLPLCRVPQTFVENLVEELYQVFKKDSGFSKSLFKRQVCPVCCGENHRYGASLLVEVELKKHAAEIVVTLVAGVFRTPS